MGQISDMETQRTDESIAHLTTENTTLTQWLRQLTQDNRALDERLQAARSNSRFQDRRIAQLEARLLEDRGRSSLAEQNQAVFDEPLQPD